MGKFSGLIPAKLPWFARQLAEGRVAGAVAILLVAAVAFGFRLGAAKLWDIDEPRNAGCAVEMLERSDFVVPVFNGELRTHKPVLLYWEMMLAYTGLGISEFSARLPSALLGLGTCLLTWWIGSRLFSPRVGTLAGCALATNIMFMVASRAATPDATLIFFMTAALAVFVAAAFEGSSDAARDERMTLPSSDEMSRREAARRPLLTLHQAIAVSTLVAFAVLAKGPVGFVIPIGIAGLFFLITTRKESNDDRPSSGDSRRWAPMRSFVRIIQWLLQVFHPVHLARTTWRMRPIMLAIGVALVAGPWYAWVGWRTDGEWLRGFFLEHNLGRATTAMEGHRGPMLLFYPAAILVGFFPWSLFAVPVIFDLLRVLAEPRHRRATTFLVGWVAFVVILFSVAKTKLPSYVTPAYPALAILTANFLMRWSRNESSVACGWMRLAYACGATVGIALMIALPLLADRYLSGNAWLGLVGLLPALMGVAGWWLVANERYRRFLPAFHVLASASVLLVAFGWGAVEVSRQQQYDRLLHRFPPEETPVAALGCLEPSWVFYSRRVIPEVRMPYPDADVSSDSTHGSNGWFRRQEPLNVFWKRYPNAFVLMTEETWRRLGGSQRPWLVVARAHRFLKPGTVLLVRRRDALAVSTSHSPLSRR